jgi:AcrR family transcriptional regulator
MATTERKQREKKQRRNEIINAAEKLFYAKGFDKVTMDEIADAVELSKGSLYLVFRNKDALFFAIVARVHQEYLRQFMELLDETARGGDQIRCMIRHLVDYTKAHREYNDMARTFGPLIWARLDAEYDNLLSENAIAYNLWLDRAIRKGMEDGSVRNDLDPALLGVYISLISISVVSPLPTWDTGFKLSGIGYEDVVDSFLRFIEPAIDPCTRL